MIKLWREVDWVIMAIYRAGQFIDSSVIANTGPYIRPSVHVTDLFTPTHFA